MPIPVYNFKCQSGKINSEVFYYYILDSGIGELVEPMVWYYQKTFDLPPGKLFHFMFILLQVPVNTFETLTLLNMDICTYF